MTQPQEDALNHVVRHVANSAAAGRLPVVVFDLDSTLFSTRPRNLRILREFAQMRPQDDALRDIARALGPDDFGWEVTAPLRAHGVTNDALLADLRTFWSERFFTDAYVTSDTPTPGAPAFVSRVHAAGALVYYLTGRHVHGMAQGTAAALTTHGFPFWCGRTTLHLKPEFALDDTQYKDDALATIRSHFGEVVATFENEPKNANLFHRAFPAAHHFLLLTEHSPNPDTPDPALTQIEDFRTGV